MPDQEAAEPDPARPAATEAPVQVRLAALLLIVEGVFVVGAGLVWMVLTFTGRPGNLGASIIGALLAIVFGAVLVRLGVGVGRGQQWARSPAVAIEILLLPVSFALVFKGGVVLYGVPLLVIAVAVIYLLFTRPAHAIFDREFNADR